MPYNIYYVLESDEVVGELVTETNDHVVDGATSIWEPWMYGRKISHVNRILTKQGFTLCTEEYFNENA